MAPSDKLIGVLNTRYLDEAKATAGPKYDHLYQAVLTAVRDGVLVSGDRLPSEKELSEKLPVSQITVRKCFMLLAQRGVISREHGRGTFVSSAEHCVSDLWHFRFKDPDSDDYLPIYSRILSRTVKRQPKIARRLAHSNEEFVRIERALNIGSRFNCYSELFLPAEKFSQIMDEPIVNLERYNLKDVFAQKFQVPTLRVKQDLRLETVPVRAREPMNIQPDAITLSLTVTGYSFEKSPVSFQRIWIPQTEYELSLPSIAGAIERDHASPNLEVVNEE